MRYLLLGLFFLVSLFLFLQSRLMVKTEEKPVFLIEDLISENHQTKISVKIASVYKPSEYQIEILQKDYASIWAHLNHLYQTNDVEAGKEYYTEDWFKQICSHYQNKIDTQIDRKDLNHFLEIQNWSSDGLICTAIDKNVNFVYNYPNHQIKKTKADIAIILHFQGDTWRIDALKILKETTIN
jgi:hypothetical protein